ncbi:MAG: penicillin acylase family protein, partial [Pseudobdellovibrionaceae bacterium]
ETLAKELAEEIFANLPAAGAVKKKILESEDWRYLLSIELKKISPTQKNILVLKAMQSTKNEVARFKTWGDKHVQKIQTPLGLIPILGGRFSFGEYPSPGSDSTLHKARFVPGYGKREVVFGAQARHISDLSNIDENYFIMLGGNDGWLHNKNMLDQIDLWKQGKYLKIPLSIESVRKEFNFRVDTVSKK